MAAIFIVVIGGIGALEGPIIGVAIFFALCWAPADYDDWYWLVMGVVMTIMFAPAAAWGFVRSKRQIQLLPLQRRIALSPGAKSAPRAIPAELEA
ncbi:MAG: hypothetical protein KGM15_08235 [Pseudomonadota bacterium]|nr:hypothetical protein [Pseudomonadota bacterium]